MQIKDMNDKPIVIEVCHAEGPNYLTMFNLNSLEGLDFNIEDATALAYAVLSETGYIEKESLTEYDTQKVVTFLVDNSPSDDASELALLLCGDNVLPTHPEDRKYFYDMANRAIENGWTKS